MPTSAHLHLRNTGVSDNAIRGSIIHTVTTSIVSDYIGAIKQAHCHKHGGSERCRSLVTCSHFDNLLERHCLLDRLRRADCHLQGISLKF